MMISEWIDQFVSHHDPESRVSAELIRQLLTSYMATPSGRAKLLQSSIVPAQYAVQTYAKEGIEPVRIRDHEALLTVIPQEERDSAAYRQLRSIIGDAVGLRNRKV